MDQNKKYNLSTLTIHGGQKPEEVTGAVMPPVFQTSTYAQKGPGEHSGFEYSRSQNPTRFALEACLASLEGAKHALAFASGLAATDCVMHLLDSGAHIISGDDVYGGTYRIFTKVYQRHGFDFTFTDLSDPANFDAALRPETKLVWLETPTNPLLKVIPIEEIVARAKKRGIIVVVDNTFATPIFQRPLDLGADIVVHSTTKYLNGHSDVVGGAMMTSDDALFERLKFLQNAVGAIPGPWDSWLVLRGIKTLAVRMPRHAQNAKELAARLAKMPQVTRVIYPGLESHPQHAIAKRQMRDFGGMLSIDLKGGLDGTRKFLSRLQLITLAESLGGVESLACVPALMTHASIPAEQRHARGIGDGLVRLSIGIEDVEDLWSDIQEGLSAV
jgi:cystathionine gamma-lyase